jgi:hypothetical protein
MTLVESEGLNIQEKYFLEKGLIRDILSPCAMHVVLTLNNYGE